MPSRLKARRRLRGYDSLNICLSILPITILSLLIIVYPLISIIYHGFTKWTIEGTDWVALDNYRILISSERLFQLFRSNLVLLLAIPAMLFFSLIVAYLLYQEIYGWKIFRILFYLPSLLSSIVIGFLFRTFFSLHGPLNELLRLIKLDFLIVNWLSRGSTSFVVIIAAIIWSQFGMAVFIFLAGMSSIDMSVLESAVVDGANWWQRFFSIVMPMIISTIEFFMIILIIIFFSASFGFIYSITSGGPAYATTTLEYMIYLRAFKSNMLGQSSALATILFIVVLAIVIIVFKIFRKLGEWQE